MGLRCPGMATTREALKVYVSAEDAAHLRRLAQAEDRPVTSIVRRLIREYLAAETNGKAA